MTKGNPLILAGDIGGTRTRLGVFKIQRGLLRPLYEGNFLSKNYKSLEDILKEFLKKDVNISVACLGLAAPITGRIIKFTNLPWKIDPEKLKREFSIKRLELLNDLLANAYGIFGLKKTDFFILNRGKVKPGNIGLLSAGTGLGEAIIFWDGKNYIPFPSEGGHAEFAPRNEMEIELLHYLIKRFHHVSYERVLSGSGLFHIYQFLKEKEKSEKEPKWLSEMMQQGDPAVVISQMARAKKSKLCWRSLDMFISIYGAAAGNLALHFMAIGGIFLGGGIAPKILWKLKDGAFMKAFKDKGRYSELVSQIPVKVILNEKSGLFGALYRAKELLKEF